jgi:hypothetical protein
LLTRQEREDLDTAVAPDSFGLAGLGAAVCFVAGLILVLHTVSTAGYTSPLPFGSAALLIGGGEYLRRRAISRER